MSLKRMTSSQLIGEAERLEKAGYATEALEYGRRAVKLEPADPELIIRFGRLATRLEEWEEAEQAFLSAINLASDQPYTYECLGLLHLNRNDLDDLELAQHYFRRSLEIEKSATSYTLLGVTQYRLDLINEARESLHKALKFNPENEEVYYNLALTYQEENPSEAIDLLRKSLQIDPNYACAHRELGWMLRLLGQYPDAEYHLRRAIELDTEEGWAYLYLANLMWERGDLTAAEQGLIKATEAWPNDILPYQSLAFYYQYQGRIEDAERLYRKSLELDPSDLEANLRFGLFLKSLGEVGEARVYLKNVLILDPQNEEATSALAEIE